MRTLVRFYQLLSHERFARYRNELGILAAIIVVMAGTAALSPAYWALGSLAETLRVILRESALVGIFALGAATVIISGGIDLSSGSVIAFSGMFFFCMLVLFAPDNPVNRFTGKPDIVDRYVRGAIKEHDVDESGGLSREEAAKLPYGNELVDIFPQLSSDSEDFELDAAKFVHRDARALVLADFLTTYDSNNSGGLDEDEVGAYHAAKKSSVERLDEDGNGELSIREMAFRYAPDTKNISWSLIAGAVVATLVVGFLIGTFHTWLITVVNLPPFVATLASLVGIRSLAEILIIELAGLRLADGQDTHNITIANETLISVGGRNWWFPCVVWLILCFGLWVLLSRTVAGRQLYAIGGNEEAARLSGIRTERLKWMAYCISSMTASIAGIFYVCYIGASNPSSDGMGYELNAIASSVVGGCSLAGGVGTVAGVMLGTVFLQVVIDSVAKLFKSHPDLFEGMVVGSLVIFAVAITTLRESRHIRKQFFPGALGLCNVGILSVLMGIVTSSVVAENRLTTGVVCGVLTLVVLSAKAIAERAALANENA